MFIQGQAAFADDVTLGDGVFSDVLAIGGAVGSSLTAKNVNVSNFSELIIGGAFLGGPGQSGKLTLTGAVNLDGSLADLLFNNTDNFTFTAPVDGVGSVVADGSGVVTMDITAVGAGYTGELTISSGAVLAETAAALGEGVTVEPGASLELPGNFECLVGLTLNGDGLNGKGAVEALAGGAELGGPPLISLDSDASIDFNFVANGDDLLTIDLGEIALLGHTLTFGGGGQIFCDDQIIAD